MQSISLNQQELSVGTIFCIGRNYHEHIKELSNAVPSEPVVFLKPNAALLREGHEIILPAYSKDIHYECELVIYIDREAQHVTEAQALSYVGGYGIGLDLTARDVQSEAKAKGLPWTKAKGFRGAACVSRFVPAHSIGDIQEQRFQFSINGEIRQQGCSTDMIFSVPQQIAYLSEIYGLHTGDLIFTGTPAGVGVLRSGDNLLLQWDGVLESSFTVR